VVSSELARSYAGPTGRRPLPHVDGTHGAGPTTATLPARLGPAAATPNSGCVRGPRAGSLPGRLGLPGALLHAAGLALLGGPQGLLVQLCCAFVAPQWLTGRYYVPLFAGVFVVGESPPGRQDPGGHEAATCSSSPRFSRCGVVLGTYPPQSGRRGIPRDRFGGSGRKRGSQDGAVLQGELQDRGGEHAQSRRLSRRPAGPKHGRAVCVAWLERFAPPWRVHLTRAASGRAACAWRGSALPEYPPTPDALDPATRAFAYPDAGEPPIPSRVATRDIDALLAYLPARRTHSSLAQPPAIAASSRAAACRQGQVSALQAALASPAAPPVWPSRSKLGRLSLRKRGRWCPNQPSVLLTSCPAFEHGGQAAAAAGPLRRHAEAAAFPALADASLAVAAGGGPFAARSCR
jgi:hypothetical protein